MVMYTSELFLFILSCVQFGGNSACFHPLMQWFISHHQPNPNQTSYQRWHIGSRRCVERFHNEDGTITSSLAISSNFLAVGAEGGVVNLYNDRQSSSITSRSGTGNIALTATTERTPLKSIMNLTTSADNVCFNHDGQILAMSTRRETNGLKLLHVPTATVFSNWPTSKTPLKYVWSMDFSPGSKYFAVGNDHGKCLLYRLKHYWDE